MDPVKTFLDERKARIELYGSNKGLIDSAAAFMRETTPTKYSYNFEWCGRPIIQYPQDIVAMQEIIWRVKSDLIIETGIAHGGSLVFYASMLQLLGRGMVLGVDVDIRSHNYSEIINHPMAGRVQMIEGSSIDSRTIDKIRAVAEKHDAVLVCLDSLHTHEHVAKELELYSDFVTRGSYLVVFDTVIEHLPEGKYPDRPWGKGNNPATAVRAFLERDKRFEVDKEYDRKLLITVTPGGYLRRIR
ncbi:MAG: cephalosporin hydroxylase family protein [Planctomycetes bacterium]|nr:cephalosporin hydroxylase family protein [Planctomycetota bacterium]